METSSISVVAPDGKKFKMTVRGDLSQLRVSKIKSYLESACGIPSDEQVLIFHGMVLRDDQRGHNIGLVSGSVLNLEIMPNASANKSVIPRSHSVNSAFRDPSHNFPITQDKHLPRTSCPHRELATTLDSNANDMDSPSDMRNRHRTACPHDDTRSTQKAHSLCQIRERCPLSQVASSGQGLTRARVQLRRLAQDLGVCEAEVDFDENMTCVIGWEDDVTVLVTYDAATERCYLYSTLLTCLPRDPHVRLRLYEMVLEGAALGRDVAGGSIGISTKNDLMILATSVDVLHTDDDGLRHVAPMFMDALMRWRALCNACVSGQ